MLSLNVNEFRSKTRVTIIYILTRISLTTYYSHLSFLNYFFCATFKKYFQFLFEIVKEFHPNRKKSFFFSFTDSSQTMVKRWKFSHPNTIYPHPYVEVDSGLFLAGDSFGGPSVTGAFLSAEMLASHFLSDKE